MVVGLHWPIIVNLLGGSLAGAWFGAGWATQLKSETLYRVIAVPLVIIAGVLLFAHDSVAGAPPFIGWMQIMAGIAAGFVIGVVASLRIGDCHGPAVKNYLPEMRPSINRDDAN